MGTTSYIKAGHSLFPKLQKTEGLTSHGPNLCATIVQAYRHTTKKLPGTQHYHVVPTTSLSWQCFIPVHWVTKTIEV